MNEEKKVYWTGNPKELDEIFETEEDSISDFFKNRDTDADYGYPQSLKDNNYEEDEMRGIELEPVHENEYKIDTLHETSLEDMIENNKFDEYYSIPKAELEIPYLKFKTVNQKATIKTLCNNFLSKGDCSLYLEDDKGYYLFVTKVNVTPKNISLLEKVSLKNSVYYRHGADFKETLATPEQFISKIDIPLNEAENTKYWNNLLEDEKNQQSKFSIDEFYG